MARCEDYPCCGHEAGCCPDYDESGKQLNMKCTCGATLPVDARFSICKGCLNLRYMDSPDYDEVVMDDDEIVFTPAECDAEWGDW